jgi:hypothetical protein
MDNIEIEKVAFEGPYEPYKGFTIRATYLKNPKGDALIELMRDGTLVREFLYPSYKIYNLQAHFREIVDGELEGHDGGYRAASWNGITPTGPAQPLPENPT